MHAVVLLVFDAMSGKTGAADLILYMCRRLERMTTRSGNDLLLLLAGRGTCVKYDLTQ